MARSLVGGRETELKFRVDGPTAFELLARAAGASSPQQKETQTNHFFDTLDRRLDSAMHTIRLREEAGTYTLTVKGPETRRGKALTERDEEEINVSGDEARSLIDGSSSPLELLKSRGASSAALLLRTINMLVGDHGLTYIGSFKNERTRLPVTLSVGGVPLVLVFEMDRTSFPGPHVHFEVEVELNCGNVDAVAEAVRAFFKDAKVAWRQGPSKAKRFFNVVAGRAIE